MQVSTMKKRLELEYSSPARVYVNVPALYLSNIDCHLENEIKVASSLGLFF